MGRVILQNLTLSIAIAISLLVHAVLLLVHFVYQPPPATPIETGLDIILVNAKHDHAPVKAQALAQANLDGGGNADQGRISSPLPDMNSAESGDAIRQSQRRVQELEHTQLHLIAQTTDPTMFKIPASLDKPKNKPDPTVVEGADDVDANKAVARMAAEIAQSMHDQNKRPYKTFITPSTKAVGYALYYKNMQRRIEEMGTLHFPEAQGKKLYGELIVTIPIFQDGSIYEKEGGPRIEKSSGVAALDNAALRIVRDSAPFGHFPENMRSAQNDDVWVVITRFKFTRNTGLVTELKNAS